MYNSIIIALALDQGHGVRAMELAQKLRSKKSKIIAIHVIDQIPSYAKYYMTADNKGNIEKAALKAIDERLGKDKNAEALVLTGHPGRTITDYAQKIGADCIIVGSHKPGLKDFFLGSTAARIVRYSKCSVHVLR
jgi:nucleotide-binding universal stress UspA family protein